MNNIEIAALILNDLQKKIHTNYFQEKYIGEKSVAFTRKRKLTLKRLIAFLLERSTKSYAIKIDDWIERNSFGDGFTFTKQAISKARQNIPSEVFEDIFHQSALTYQREAKNKRRFQGYQVLAVDATDLLLPTTPETLKSFGNVKMRYANELAGASVSGLCDVRNGVWLSVCIKPYRTAEREMAKEIITRALPKLEVEKTIIVFDRGYPSYEFIDYLSACKINYVMRVKKQSTRMRSEGIKDTEIYRKCGKNCRTIRTLEVELEEGKEEKEYLITNLAKESVGWEEFKEIYHMRWGIESKYREIKSQLEIESFSGKRVVCIEQDFYIAMFLSNLASLLKNGVDDEIELEEKKEKTSYQGNRGFLIHQINKRISKMIIAEVKIIEVLREVVEKGKKNRSQIRRNRKCERNKNLNRRKYSMTYKLCI